MLYGKVGGGVAYLIGGLAGGIASSINEKDRMKGAMERASRTRIKEWGMKINERVQKHENSIFVPREDIKNFEVNKYALLISTAKSHFAFGSEQIVKCHTDLTDFFSGKEVFNQEHYDRSAIGLTLPAPSAFLESLVLENVKHKFSNEILSKMEVDNAYMTNLLKVFGLMEKEQVVDSPINRFTFMIS